MILIETYDDLNKWLGIFNDFEEGHVIKIDKDPFAITVGITICGTYEANTEKEIASFTIIPKNVFSCDYPLDFIPSEDSYIEYIKPFEATEGIGLEIFGPPILTIIAKSFTISDREIIKSTFKPYINRQDIFARFPMEEIPKPHFWKEQFKELGYDINFRILREKAYNLMRSLIRIIQDIFFNLKVASAILNMGYSFLTVRLKIMKYQ